MFIHISPLSANPTKWSNTFKQFVGNLPTNFLNVLDHFMGWVFKGLELSLFLPNSQYNRKFFPNITWNVSESKLINSLKFVQMSSNIRNDPIKNPCRSCLLCLKDFWQKFQWLLHIFFWVIERLVNKNFLKRIWLK